MRSLADLIAVPAGRAFLEDRGVALTVEGFVERVRPPARDGLGDVVDLPPGTPVYTAHQLQCDYAASVTSKLRALGEVGRHDGVATVALWLDMDRTGSNKLSTSILWPEGGSVRLAPQRFKEREPRFVPVERGRLEEVAVQLEAWARTAGAPPERHHRLAEALLGDDVSTLAEANLRLTTALLREHLGIESPSALISDLASRGLLTPGIEAAMADLDGFVSVFNASVDAIVAADVDPQVRHLPEDYLPLRYSCSACGARCTLVHRRRGGDHLGETTCRSCGTEHSFHLGTGRPSAQAVLATGRWSTDVTLPAYVNDLVGGVVVGRSSALYGLILNEVGAKVLGSTPVPMLIPPDLGEVLTSDAADSLVHEYLTT
jgi:hypothetical protein